MGLALFAEEFLAQHNRRPGGSIYDEMQKRENEQKRLREEQEKAEVLAAKKAEEERVALAIKRRYGQWYARRLP